MGGKAISDRLRVTRSPTDAIMNGVHTYRLCETHEAIERHAVVREIDRLSSRNAEGVRGESQAGDADVVLDDVALDVARAVRDLELFAQVLEGRRALRAEEVVVALETRELVSYAGLSIRRETRPHTQSPPDSDWQFSAPTQRSAEPESMRMLKSRGGVPIWIVAI